MSVRLVSVVVLIFASLSMRGQQTSDSLISISSDTLRMVKGKKVINIDTYAARFNPRKALLYSAIFPGSGQVYNKKYWKLPIVYGGFATTVYLVTFYQDSYLTRKNELFTLVSDGALISPTGYRENQLRRLVDRSKRERDFWSIVTGFWYILQLVDAHVDAHLKEFDVNPQLQVSLEPIMENNPMIGRSTGVALVIKF